MRNVGERFSTVILTLLAAGCGSPFMQPAAAPPVLSREMAYLCFLRPSALGPAATFDVFDEQLRFLGEAVSTSYWTIAVEPGEHWLYAGGENISVMHANVLAGRTYYVVVRPRLGAIGPRVQLTALAPRTQEWEKLGDWLADSDQLVADRKAGQAEFDKDVAAVRAQMLEAVRVWRSMNAAERELHTLYPTDGTAF